MDLLLAAFPPELAGLDLRPPEGWEVHCTGVGALQAALATARLLEELRPGRVLFMGTCGALDGRLKVGAHLAAAEAIACSVEERRGGAYRPSLEVHRWSAGWLPPFPAHPVAVPPAITATAEGAALLSALAPAEHLELSGVFAACAAAEVPAGAALAVANAVGPDAHREWASNHTRVSRELAEALRGAGIL